MQNNIWKQRLHIEPQKGWLNDPNGLVYFNNKYHIFHQYSYEVNGGKKYWYYYTSSDLINYDDKGIFLSPDTEYDKSGVYSGSANIEDNKLVFYYTGNVKASGNYDYVHSGRGHNTIKVTTEDLINISEKECILDNSDYPNMSNHVRDPKVFEKNNDNYLLLGARDSNDYGCLLIYKNMEYYKTVYSKKNLGYMWECPDYFAVDNREVFLFSPQGITNMYKENKNVYQIGYSLIDEGIENLENIDNFSILDYGHDFYATQTFIDENGKRVMCAWMYVPDSPYTNPTTTYGYQNCLTLPRILNVKNNKLVQKFHNSVYEMIENKVTENEFNFTTWYYKSNESSDFSIKIDSLEIIYKNKELTVNLNDSGYGRDNRRFDIELFNIEIIFDSSSFEILANDGEFSFSSRYYPKNHKTTVKAKNHEIYKLSSINIRR